MQPLTTCRAPARAFPSPRGRRLLWAEKPGPRGLARPLPPVGIRSLRRSFHPPQHGHQRPPAGQEGQAGGRRAPTLGPIRRISAASHPLAASASSPPPTPHNTQTPPRPPSPPRGGAGPDPLPAASMESQAAGAAQAVTQGGSGGGRSRRRRREQMALKKTREPAARAHIQLASARRAGSTALPLASSSPSNAS
ncbi:proline-rich protein 2-like [Ochotona princeps]|uniref:proline-rich protein 2-like n=1 Tax=Ochotona princeps TaxID=9978 RepID=UPI002714F54D|nr:proline-rich protein 2-like [Ochotona princeps]